jgi:hypothetical protein
MATTIGKAGTVAYLRKEAAPESLVATSISECWMLEGGGRRSTRYGYPEWHSP